MNLSKEQQAELDIFQKYRKEVPYDILSVVVGGSTLYGLTNDTSDLDLRGLYGLNDPNDILGLGIFSKRSMDSWVLTNDTEGMDASMYEWRHFIRLLRNTNSQVLELLYAPDEFVLETSEPFEEMRRNKHRLIDVDSAYKTLVGYIEGERRLMNGERPGRLGSKRKGHLKQYGYSYKNLIQIIRLGWCGEILFQKGVYPTNVIAESEEIFYILMDIKENPSQYNLKHAEMQVQRSLVRLETAYKSRINHGLKFDLDYAQELAYNYYIAKLTP